jgi:hypothetical protein
MPRAFYIARANLIQGTTTVVTPEQALAQWDAKAAWLFRRSQGWLADWRERSATVHVDCERLTTRGGGYIFV